MKLFSKDFFIFFILFLLLFIFTFRDLLFNLTTNLIDWRDYSLMVWIIYQNATKILGLNFMNYFDTNIFYPNKLNLLFSDLLLPQAILSLPFFLITKNLILIFNSVFINTFILNYLSLYLFWRQIFKSTLVAFLGSLFFIFSPFFHLELSHFQMLSYWPFFLSLYFLFKYDSNKYNLFLSGFFLAVQFLASVYLSVYLITVTTLYLLINSLFLKSPRKFVTSILIIFGTFLVLDGYFITKYFEVKKIYNIQRELKDYITYSAHLSDYLFTSQINSTLHNLNLIEKWNSSDKNFTGGHGSSPGILFLSLALISIFSLSIKKKLFSLSISLDQQKAFFLAIALTGLIFSLGPRLNFNGNYAHIPLPYTLALKTFPLMESTRAPARWSFLFFLGIIYFALSTINSLQGKKSFPYILLAIFILFLAEYLPSNLKTEKNSFINEEYIKIKQICSEDKRVLLEIPITHLDVQPNVAVGLTYITKVQLASTYHNCYLVNGYSGYDLPENFALKDSIYKAIENNDVNNFIKILKTKEVAIVKLNKQYLTDDLKLKSTIFMQTLSRAKGVKEISNDIFLMQ